MRCSRPLTVVLALALILGSTAAHAQTVDRLRPDTIEAASLSDAQQDQINLYIEHWTQRLQDAEDPQVTNARQRLLEPLRAPRISDTFASFYSETLSENLLPALDSDRLIVRLNTMIVVTRITGDAAMPLIEKGLQDSNAAVRYRAIKAVQLVNFSQDSERTLLDQLIEHLDREDVLPVAEQVMVALVELDLPDARSRALEVLNNRVSRHAQNAGRSLQAEYAGLQRVYRQLAGADNPDSNTLRQLARTAVRYQDLAARQLQADDLEDEHREDHINTIELANATLRFVADNLNVNNTPASPQASINQENWQAIQQNADDWRTLLQRSPFNLTAQDLALTSD